MAVKRPEELKTYDTLLVSIDYTHGGKDNAVLIVGRKHLNQSVDIVNAFQGQEALDIYNRLIQREEGKEIK